MRLRSWALPLFIILSIVCSPAVFAASSSNKPILNVGANFFAGDVTNSLTGALGYFIKFVSEDGKGHLRPYVGAHFEYAAGDAYINSSATTFTLYGGDFVLGYNFFLFETGSFQPFVGGAGVFGWNYLQVGDESVDPYSQGFSYGYEVNGGVDIRFKKSSKGALRLQGGLWALTGQVAGSTSFPLTGFRFTMGVIF